MFFSRLMNPSSTKSIPQWFAHILHQALPLWDAPTQETMSILLSDDQFELVMQSLQEVKQGDVVRSADVFADLVD
jgi:hypothetical protein